MSIEEGSVCVGFCGNGYSIYCYLNARLVNRNGVSREGLLECVDASGKREHRAIQVGCFWEVNRSRKEANSEG